MSIEQVYTEVYQMEIEQKIYEVANSMYSKELKDLDNAQVYNCVLQATKDFMEHSPAITGDKKIYYISAEFLIGKLLSNNLINLGS